MAIVTFLKKVRASGTAAALSLILWFPVAAAAQGATPRSSEGLEPGDSLEGNYLAAIVAGAGRDLGAASVYLREAVKEDPQNNDLLERAFVAFLADGSMPDAFRAADRLIRIDPSNGLAQLVVGVRAIKQKSYATARNHLQRGGRGRAADITATLLSAWSYLGSNNPKRAIETLERLKGEPSYNLFRDYHAGLILDAAGRKAEAEKRLKAAYDAEKTTLRLVDLWARLQARQGDFAGAAATYADFDRLLPNHRSSARAWPSSRRRRRRRARSPTPSRAPPRCSTASPAPATGRATRPRRCSICAWRSTSTPATTSPS